MTDKIKPVVLVVSNDVNGRLALTRELSEAGYRIAWRRTLHDLHRWAKRYDPELVVVQGLRKDKLPWLPGSIEVRIVPTAAPAGDAGRQRSATR